MQNGVVILASQSLARLGVLRAAGVEVEARPARVDEAAVKAGGRAEGAEAEDVAFALAGMKASRVREMGAVVIGADQVLVCEGTWFDKPGTMAEARGHLQALRGRVHELVTAVVVHRDGAEIWRHLARPRLRMRGFSEAFLEAYLASEGEVLLSTVGAYRLEGVGIRLFDRVEGEHGAILGLPMLPLLGFLGQAGVLMQ